MSGTLAKALPPCYHENRFINLIGDSTFHNLDLNSIAFPLFCLIKIIYDHAVLLFQ